MSQYSFPEGMRFSSLIERSIFYDLEFQLNSVKSWIDELDHAGNLNFALVMGRHTKIFLEKYKEDALTTIIIDHYHDLNDVKDQILDFLPESVYYDRNIYNDEKNIIGQQLAFDLDPENVTCPIHGDLGEKMKRRQGLSFCEVAFGMVKEQTLELCDFLRKRFSGIKIVYSGRGFHVHVLDEAAYSLNREKRREIAKEVKEKGFAIDEWVTAGEMRLIRLPFSLNGLVSRIVLPLEVSEILEFDPVMDSRCIPRFLKAK